MLISLVYVVHTASNTSDEKQKKTAHLSGFLWSIVLNI